MTTYLQPKRPRVSETAPAPAPTPMPSGGIAKSNKPHALGEKPKKAGFSIFGFFKRSAGVVLRGLKKVVVAAGNVAQEVLNAFNTFPFLKPLAKFPIPIPGFGAIKLESLLKGVAVVGRVTERLANAFEVYAKGGSFADIVKELPISDVVMFVLSPILDKFKGILAIARVPESVAVKRVGELAKKLKGLIAKIPPPMRLAVIKGIEEKLGLRFPPQITEALLKA